MRLSLRSASSRVLYVGACSVYAGTNYSLWETCVHIPHICCYGLFVHFPTFFGRQHSDSISSGTLARAFVQSRHGGREFLSFKTYS